MVVRRLELGAAALVHEHGVKERGFAGGFGVAPGLYKVVAMGGLGAAFRSSRLRGQPAAALRVRRRSGLPRLSVRLCLRDEALQTSLFLCPPDL